MNPNDTTNPWQQVIQIYHPTGVKSDNPSLADGSVVIFDPQAIRADRLKLAPPLPLPKTETAKLKGKQTDFSTYVRQDRPRGSVAEPLIAPAPPRKFPQEFESLLLDNPEAPPTETVLPASGTQPLTPTTEAELATEPSTEDAQEDSETTPLVPADRGTQVKILGGVLLFLMTFGIGVILNQARHEVDRPANASLTPVVARPIAPQEPAPTATVSLVDAAKIFPADRPTKRDTALDALIENRIPLHLEPIVLPAALQLFGRPIGHRTLIIDRQHAVPQPHFEEKVARESVATRVAAATRETSETVLPDALERALGRVKRSQTVARAS